MFNWLFKRSLDSVINETKTIYINRVRFRIKKINALNYLDGSKVLKQVYEQYKIGKTELANNEVNDKKVKEHISHVICAGVINPKIGFKKEEDNIAVDELFVDLDMTMKLYEEIMSFTYGKKKLQNI